MADLVVLTLFLLSLMKSFIGSLPMKRYRRPSHDEVIQKVEGHASTLNNLPHRFSVLVWNIEKQQEHNFGSVFQDYLGADLMLLQEVHLSSSAIT